ncbi:MAG: multiheme c-type cytochrome [Planctomycetota bacterium]|jgi:hypothetical protein
MTLKVKRIVIASLSAVFLISLLFVQWMEIIRKRQEAGLAEPEISVAAESWDCWDCHKRHTPGIVTHWEGSTHAVKGVACIECHQAEKDDPDAFDHEGVLIATLVTPRDCGRCHENEYREFAASHHAAGGNILHSLDNFLAETVEGGRAVVDDQVLVSFDPHSPTPGMTVEKVNGLAAAFTGCQQCHGSKVALQGKGEAGEPLLITIDELRPDENGKPANRQILAQIVRDDDGKPLFHDGTWPNTGIGRLNLDGSRGSCSACHSRHDFSPRRARQPENCAKCHLGPDHPQKEIFEESKHGIAYRDLKDNMHLDSVSWVLGKDYSAAPTCATCHLSAHSKKGKISHDPGRRISWTNRPAISLVMDTDKDAVVIKEKDPAVRRALLEQKGAESAQVKRTRMKNVCSHCHTPDYINGFYSQYDDFVVLYNEKFAKPGQAIMDKLKETGITTTMPFDEEIEWTWFYLWHHEGRRARHGASMMAPDYAHWHGTYEVAERFYQQLIPQARHMAAEARAEGKTEEADAVIALIDEILSRSEHAWFEREKKPRAEAADGE